MEKVRHVELPLEEYNQLYERAYFAERTAELERERRALEEQRQKQEEAYRQRARQLEESKARAAREQRGAVTSQNWLLTRHEARGSCESGAAAEGCGMAAFDFELEFKVFDPEWTVIPLVDSQVIADDWRVQRADLSAAPSEGAPLHWEAVTLVSDAVLLEQELDGAPPRRVLAVAVAGLYRVSFRAYVSVQAFRSRCSLSLHLLHPVTSVRLQMRRRGGARALVRELSTTPAAQHVLEEAEGAIDVVMRLPSTKTVEVKWREVEAADAEWECMSPDGAAEKVAAEKEQPQVTVVHDALHTVMDGVLSSSHTLKYCMDSEQRSLASTCFTVFGSARVTSVTGHGVTSWKATAATPGDEPATEVEVSFSSAVNSDAIIIIVSTELEMGPDTLTVPRLVCKGVLRQTGSLGIVKMADLEVHVQDSKGMARVGVDELAPELKYQTSRPIMFAYKYLSPHSSANLRIVKHEDVHVLEAVAESAFYEVLVSEGQSMRRLMLNLQNSRKQYLQLQGIPAQARLWSLMVNSKPAKPARGQDGSLLVPLLVGTAGASNEGAQAASVEIAYLVQCDPLSSEGTLDLAPPRLDVPISALLTEVQWPSTHSVKFAGSLQCVGRFSHALPKAVNHDVGTDVVPSGFDFNKLPAHVPRAGVNVQVPRAGERHRFEQLLVVDGGATLTAEYKVRSEERPRQREGWLASLRGRFCQRRAPAC